MSLVYPHMSKNLRFYSNNILFIIVFFLIQKMITIPVSHGAITKFVKQQEDEICEGLVLDKVELKRLRHSGIKLTRQEWSKLMYLINESLNDKYRTLYFNKQSRTKIVQQITQIERSIGREQIDNLDKVNDILSVFNIEDFNSNYIGGGMNNVLLNNPQRNMILEMVYELPNSNGLDTSNLDLIEEYDEVREDLKSNIERLKELRNKIDLVNGLKDKVKVLNGQDFNLSINEEMEKELTRTLTLL